MLRIDEHYQSTVTLEGPEKVFEEAGHVEYTLKLDKPSTKSQQFRISTRTNTALGGERRDLINDFHFVAKDVTIPAGRTQAKFTVEILDDNTYEGGDEDEGENFFIEVFRQFDSSKVATKEVVILDNEYRLSFNESQYVADEGSGNFSVQICTSRNREGINPGFTFTSSGIVYVSQRPADLAPDDPWTPPPPLVVPYNPPSLEGKTFYFDSEKNSRGRLCMNLKIPIHNDNEVRGSGNLQIKITATDGSLFETANITIKEDDTRASYPAGRIQMSFPKSDLRSTSFVELEYYRNVEINDANYRDCKAQAGGSISNHTITEGDTFCVFFNNVGTSSPARMEVNVSVSGSEHLGQSSKNYVVPMKGDVINTNQFYMAVKTLPSTKSEKDNFITVALLPPTSGEHPYTLADPKGLIIKVKDGPDGEGIFSGLNGEKYEGPFDAASELSLDTDPGPGGHPSD